MKEILEHAVKLKNYKIINVSDLLVYLLEEVYLINICEAY